MGSSAFVTVRFDYESFRTTISAHTELYWAAMQFTCPKLFRSKHHRKNTTTKTPKTPPQEHQKHHHKDAKRNNHKNTKKEQSHHSFQQWPASSPPSSYVFTRNYLLVRPSKKAYATTNNPRTMSKHRLSPRRGCMGGTCTTTTWL